MLCRTDLKKVGKKLYPENTSIKKGLSQILMIALFVICKMKKLFPKV